jgi:copper homeostasis protein
MSAPLIELCIERPDDAAVAQEVGADRVELCSSLIEGGLTPSAGAIRRARAVASLPVHAMIRPRGGDFAYDAGELAAMHEDVAMARASGAAAVVFGCLTFDGDIDEAATAALVAAARPMRVTVHRAFDMTRDPAAALEALIRCGVDRVLSSGQRPTAVEGIALLRALVQQAGERIVIMGCGDLSPDSVAAVRRETGLGEIHFAALAAQPSPMRFRNPAVGMGGTVLEREYTRYATDAALARATIAAARAA